MSEQSSAAASSQISELKVSGHMMSLEPGLYCVFSAPGGAMPDPSTGLPVVRITAAPGRHSGRIKTVGMETEGWIGPDAATLVRVTDARSELLVTVYQAIDSRSEPPAIQVVRISGVQDAMQAATGRGTEPAPQAAQVEVVGHIYARGDVGALLGEWMGEPGSKRWIEGFGIAPVRSIPPSDLEYQAVLGRGWLSPWSEGGQFCGSRGMSLPILGLRVRLRGASAATHKIVLSASFVDGTQIGPVGAEEACEAPSLAALEAFQVAIVPVGALAAKRSGKKAPVLKEAPKTEPAPKELAPKKLAPKELAPKELAKKPASKAARKPAPAPRRR